MKKIRTAEILCVGTEILIGDIVNTNAAYISKRLADLGIAQYHQGVVGDNPQRLKKYLSEAMERCDLVILTGGLGPTYDDLTKETVAELCGKRMLLHEGALENIKEIFKTRNLELTENNIKQAYMPEGCTVFENKWGTAPGAAIETEKGDKAVIILPGPPREMKPMFEQCAVPYLERFTDYKLVSKNVNIFGMGESKVESELIDLMKNSTNPTVAPYASDGEVRLRVTAKADNGETGERLCDLMIEKLRNTRVGEYIYGVDTTSEETLVKALTEKEMKIAVAESCTGGLVTKLITGVSGASKVLDGSIVSYANEIKNEILGVDSIVLQNKGAVSSECAVAMAGGVRKLMSADIGLSVTGIAGPTGGTAEKPVGTVYIAVSTEYGQECKKLTLRDNGREYIRALSAKNAIHLAIDWVKKSKKTC